MGPGGGDDAGAALVGVVAAPGDAVLALTDGVSVAIGAGGLRDAGDAVVATKAGVVRRTRAGTLWLEGRQKRYIPAEGDSVVGVVVDRMSEARAQRARGPCARARARASCMLAAGEPAARRPAAGLPCHARTRPHTQTHTPRPCPAPPRTRST